MEAKTSNSLLNPFELEVVLKWVDSFELSRCSRKLNRDFSDGVLLAEILKFEFPALVDLHNYNGCSASQGKIENWCTLNRKVLKKLRVQLQAGEIEMIAKAESDCIEGVLSRVMNQIKLMKARSASNSKLDIPEQAEIITVKVMKQVGGQVEEASQRMVLYSLYEEQMEKCELQKLQIHEMEEIISDMNDALNSKSQIIEDLQERLEKKKKRSSISMASIKQSVTNFF